MADIRPFRGLRYDPGKVRIDDVVAPPYDIIYPEEAKRLRARSPHNIVHVDLPDGPNPYAHAAQLLESWCDAGVIRRDPEPSFYLITDTFEVDGSTFRRTGITAAVRLEPLGEGSIYPHEATLSAPKLDRFRLMATTTTNLSPVLAMASDPDSTLRNLISPSLSHPPILSGQGPTGKFELRRITDPSTLSRISSIFADRPLFIADGHHRYETALNYHRTAAGTGNYLACYVMMHLLVMEDPALKVLPTHRLLRPGVAPELPVFLDALRKDFVVTEMPASGSPQLPASDAPAGTYILYTSRKIWRISLKSSLGPADIDSERSADWCRLDVAVLQKRVFEPILGITPEKLTSHELLGYSHDQAETVDEVNSGDFALAFLLRGTPVQSISAVASRLETMPPKSTYFYPKTITGLVLRGIKRT